MFVYWLICPCYCMCPRAHTHKHTHVHTVCQLSMWCEMPPALTYRSLVLSLCTLFPNTQFCLNNWMFSVWSCCIDHPLSRREGDFFFLKRQRWEGSFLVITSVLKMRLRCTEAAKTETQQTKQQRGRIEHCHCRQTQEDGAECKQPRAQMLKMYTTGRH